MGERGNSSSIIMLIIPIINYLHSLQLKHMQLKNSAPSKMAVFLLCIHVLWFGRSNTLSVVLPRPTCLSACSLEPSLQRSHPIVSLYYVPIWCGSLLCLPPFPLFPHYFTLYDISDTFLRREKASVSPIKLLDLYFYEYTIYEGQGILC